MPGPFTTASHATRGAFNATTNLDAPNVSPSGIACIFTLPISPCVVRAALQATVKRGGPTTF
jgi:hypothetical protein